LIPTSMFRRLRAGRVPSSALALAAALSACGGGGGGEPAATPVVPPVTPASLVLKGTAAVGKAVVGPVTAVCASGTGTATAAANGSFEVAVANGKLPCVLRITDAASGVVLHSVAIGDGSSATANITPLTELVLTQASGGTAAALYTGFDAAGQAKVSAAALASATTSVATALQSVLSLAGVNPFTDVLVAANGNAPGNGLDQKLDALAAALAAAKLSLADVGSVIVANGAAASTVLATQVKPAAASCASARSGHYQIINPNESEDRDRFAKITFDAQTLTADGPEFGTPDTLSPVTGRPCQFVNRKGEQFVVSPGGVLVNRYVDFNGTARLAVAIPAQTVPLADLAGAWQSTEFEQNDNGGSWVNSHAKFTLDASGKVTALADCKQLLPCTDSPRPGRFQANAAGGFDLTDATNGGSLRVFAVRAASGDITLFGLFARGVMVATRPVSFPARNVGDVSPLWNVSVSGNNITGPLTEDTSTVVSVNAAADSFTRSTKFGGGRLDTFLRNTPRIGVTYRAVNACTNSAGMAINCSGYFVTPLPGLGMQVQSSAVDGNSFFGFSVSMPAGVVTNDGTPVDPVVAAPATGTLVFEGNKGTYALRAGIHLNSTGLIDGGNYDFHTLSGTLTPCTYSPANQNTCFGTSAPFNTTSQGAMFTTAGAATATMLRAGPDQYGYTFTGTITGTLWTGTFTQVDNATSVQTGSGRFAVNLGITQN